MYYYTGIIYSIISFNILIGIGPYLKIYDDNLLLYYLYSSLGKPSLILNSSSPILYDNACPGLIIYLYISFRISSSAKVVYLRSIL